MDEHIAQFVSITGADEERAKFFVESANGDIETALSTFYEADGAEASQPAEEVDAMVEEQEEIPTPASVTGPRTLSGAPASEETPANWGKQAAKSSSKRKGGDGFSASGGRGGGGIATFRDLQNGADDDDDDIDGKKPAKFYTGGERSGLNVLNPDQFKDDNTPDIVQKIIKKAAEATEQRGAGQPSAKAGASSSTPSFGGRGRTINDDASQDESQGGTRNALHNSSEGSALSQAPQRFPPPPSGGITPEYLRGLRNMPLGGRNGPMIGQGLFPGMGGDDDYENEEGEEEVAIRRVVFWQDGFTIAGGPLCRYDDPVHAETLTLLNNNHAPTHLLNLRFGQKVNLHIERRTNEKYKAPPPPPMKPFDGQGNRLGAPVPIMTGAPSTSSTATTQATSSTLATNAPDPSSFTFQVDASQPTTQIQVRLGDGQRMVAKFNHTHTVGDIRQYINASHAGMAARPYTLQSSFPPKPLTDESVSIQDAGLINSVVIQKWN